MEAATMRWRATCTSAGEAGEERVTRCDVSYLEGVSVTGCGGFVFIKELMIVRLI
jgi:hypothetical protein